MQNATFGAGHSHCHPKPTATVVPCTEPAQGWPGQQSQMGERGHETRLLTAELLATGKFWERGITAFSCVPNGEPTAFQ